MLVVTIIQNVELKITNKGGFEKNNAQLEKRFLIILCNVNENQFVNIGHYGDAHRYEI